MQDADRPISASSVVVAAERYASAELGEEQLVLDVESGGYFRLPGVGATIWDRLQEPVRVASIRDDIVRRYEVEGSEAERDLLEFLEELRDRGLIEVRPPDEAS